MPKVKEDYMPYLNRVARECRNAFMIEDVRKQVIKNLAGKKKVKVDWKRLQEYIDEDKTDIETLEIIQVMKHFTLVKRGNSKTCILHQDMYFIAGIGAR